MRVIDAGALDFASIVRAGDTVLWGAGRRRAADADARADGAAPARAAASARSSASAWPTRCSAEHADCIDFASYCGAGRNRALADGRPARHPALPLLGAARRRIAQRRDSPVDVLLLQVAPAGRVRAATASALATSTCAPALDRARASSSPRSTTGAPWTHGERIARRGRHRPAGPRVAPAAGERRAARPDAVERAHRARMRRRWSRTARRCSWASARCPTRCWARCAADRDLGIHSGTVGDGVAALIEAGAITNARKTIDRGVSVAGTMMGSARLHRWAHRNSGVAVPLRPPTPTTPACWPRIDQLVADQPADRGRPDRPDQRRGRRRRLRRRGRRRARLPARRARSRGGLPIVALPRRAGAAQPHRRARCPARSARRAPTPASSSPSTASPTCAGLRCAARRAACSRSPHPDPRGGLDAGARPPCTDLTREDNPT